MIRKLIFAAVALALTSCLPPGQNATAPSSSLGVYVNGGPTNVPPFNTWLGSNVAHGSDYFATGSWSALVSDAQWDIGNWKRANLGIQMTFALPMLPADHVSTLALGAAGNYDADFTAIGTALVSAGFPNAILRVGWEFNGGWYPWAAAKDPTNWVLFYRRIVADLRAVPGQAFKFDWNPTLGAQQIPAWNVWPGNDVVDYVGEDVYDQYYATPLPLPSPKVRWASYVNESFGLKWQAGFAATHHKPISFPEWGVVIRSDGHGGGDNPYFIQQMAAWFKANPVTYQNYFDTNNGAGFESAISPPSTLFPLSAAAYQAAFGKTPDSDVVWGVNGHPLTQAPYLSMTYAEQMQEMQSMGLTSYRVDIYDDNPSTMSALSSLITTAQQYDITILPILILNPASYANATDAYNAGYALAEAYAKEFPGMTWELGNEFDDYAILPGTTGESASNYDSAKMAVVTGLLEGMLNGIHQADPTSKGIVDEQGPHFGFFDALAADGVQWDISGLHWYSGDGDLTDVGGVNVLAELASFGHPIEITELNETNGHLSSVQMEASYLSTTMSQIDGLSSTYDITAAYIYELLDQPALSGGEATYGLANATGTINAAGEAVESFLASNPSVS